jgi:hypothetical protein
MESNISYHHPNAMKEIKPTRWSTYRTLAAVVVGTWLLAMEFFQHQCLLEIPQIDSSDDRPRPVIKASTQEASNWANSTKFEIRSWGCDRTETPLIFVHIGKSGGGSIRTRIAASSLNLTKHQLAKGREEVYGIEDGSYYPLNGTSKARFINSVSSHRLPSKERTYEGTHICHASTPVGIAIACPSFLNEARRLEKVASGECGPESDTCNVVYAGHNYFGSEMHWLPRRYLENWWNSQWSSPEDQVAPFWKKLKPTGVWCNSRKPSRRAQNPWEYAAWYDECSVPLQRQVDARAAIAIAKNLQQEDISSFSAVYASLPVLRVTVVRSPFSWLMSKYAWHWRRNQNVTCENLRDGVHGGATHLQGSRPQLIDMDTTSEGWIRRMSLGHIIYLCGEDCMMRYSTGTSNLQDLERQAEENLRHSFAVVGLLDESETFYEMLTARVGYIDTSLNPDVRGNKHHSSNLPAIEKCKKLFTQVSTEKWLVNASPEVAVLHRLYKVAKEVNRFQLNELRSCSSLPLGRNT